MKKKGNVPIVYIITKLELGGAQKVCLSLFQELEKKEHETWLISGTEGPLVATVQHLPNVILLPWLTRECSWRTIGNEFRSFFAIMGELKKLKKKHPDIVVHTHSTKAGYLGRWAAFFAGISQRIHTVHGFGFHDHQSRLGYAFAYLLELLTSSITTHYICVSSKDQATGTRLLPRFASKSSLIRAAINDDHFYPALSATQSYEAQHFIFGTVSCFKKQKNLFDLLMAFEQVYQHHPRARLEIIGDGYLRHDIEEWIASHDLEPAITLHGWKDDVASYMKHWHVFVMSSLWEGLPCAAVEARFLKLPVLSYNVGGISDLIISGKNGFLYEPRNIQQLAQGMNSLITNKALYQKLKVYTEDLSAFTRNAMILQHSILYRYITLNE